MSVKVSTPTREELLAQRWHIRAQAHTALDMALDAADLHTISIEWWCDQLDNIAFLLGEDRCSHESVDTFGRAGRMVDVCMACHQALRFWHADAAGEAS